MLNKPFSPDHSRHSGTLEDLEIINTIEPLIRTQKGPFMKIRLVILGVVAGSLIATMYCAKYEKNAVGANFFQRDDRGSEEFLVFQAAPSDTFYHTQIPTGSSPYLYLGENAEDQTRILLFFSDLPDSGRVDTAIVTLYTSRALGPATGIFSASVYRITDEWDESTITWDIFESSGLTGEEVATVDISADEIAANNDSLAIAFALPSSLVEAWMDTNVVPQNHGILISSSSAPFIVEFFSKNHAESKPILTLHVTQDATQDTLVISPEEDTFIATTQLDLTSDLLFIANGAALRSLLFFDVDTIPYDATINRALLTLYADTTQSFPDHSETFEIRAYPISNGSWPIPWVPYDTTRVLTGSIEGDSAVINITLLLQEWTSYSIENNGILLLGEDENENLLRRVFHSTSADSALRPKLEMFYSLPPSSRL